MDRRRFLRGGVAALAVGLAGCGGGDGSLVPSPTDTTEPAAPGTVGTQGGSGDAVVEMNDELEFRPDPVSIAPGEMVEWVNVGSYRHTVTAYGDAIPEGAAYFASGGFDSERAARVEDGGYIAEGGSYAHTLEVEGVYEYYCIPHENAGMVGRIEVGSG